MLTVVPDKCSVFFIVSSVRNFQSEDSGFTTSSATELKKAENGQFMY